MKDILKFYCKLEPKYKFNTCVIKTCKNFSPILSSGCMLIERKEVLTSEKVMTDHEIKYFKNYKTIKEVTDIRKKAFDRVYCILIFDRYIDFCAKKKKKSFEKSISDYKIIKRVLSKYPYKLKEFNLDFSTLSYMGDEEVYYEYSINGDCKLCNEYSQTDVMKLSERTIQKLNEIFNSMEIQNGSNK